MAQALAAVAVVILSVSLSAVAFPLAALAAALWLLLGAFVDSAASAMALFFILLSIPAAGYLTGVFLDAVVNLRDQPRRSELAFGAQVATLALCFETRPLLDYLSAALDTGVLSSAPNALPLVVSLGNRVLFVAGTVAVVFGLALVLLTLPFHLLLKDSDARVLLSPSGAARLLAFLFLLLFFDFIGGFAAGELWPVRIWAGAADA